MVKELLFTGGAVSVIIGCFLASTSAGFIVAGLITACLGIAVHEQQVRRSKKTG